MKMKVLMLNGSEYTGCLRENCCGAEILWDRKRNLSDWRERDLGLHRMQ